MAFESPGYLVLMLKFRKEGDQWTARCLELGTATFGRTLEEAQERIREAVTCHLNTLEDVGERDRFLKEHGITYHAQRPRSFRVPTTSADERTFYQAFIPPVSGTESYASV